MIRQHQRSLQTLALLAFVVHLLPGARTLDDAFITFRYSRNLVEGNGFVYNLGDKVLVEMIVRSVLFIRLGVLFSCGRIANV